MNDKADGIEMLKGVMNDEQITQLASLLKDVVQNGFGELEIVIVKGRVRFFRPQFSISACYEDEK